MIVAALAVALMATIPAQESVSTTEIEAPGPDGPLRGTMIRPRKRGPIVLIIPGSGPTDRDGNSPLGVRAATYRRLAEELAVRGVSTVRIDKRGMFASAGAVADANAVTIQDYARDTRAWAKVIRGSTGANCVWLLGHSEGGLVALAAAQETADICGLVLVATAGQPLGEVLKDQLRANPANAPLLSPAMAAIDSLTAGRRVDVKALPAPLAPLFQPAIQGFLISAFRIDPAKLAGQVRKPILVVQGERDIQVGVADARKLKEAAPSSSLVLLPDTNHVLKRVATEDRGVNIATYADPNAALAPGVVNAIAEFVTTRR
jgi:uncharacterized protein